MFLILGFIFVPFINFHVLSVYELNKMRSQVVRWHATFFFAANFHNSEDILPNWSSQFLRLAAILGPHRVFLSVYENDSTDKTKELLGVLRDEATALGVANKIVMEHTTNLRQKYPDRIEFLALVRNRALEPLYSFATLLKEEPGFAVSLSSSAHFKLVFLNDIYFKAEDVLRLIGTRSLNYDIACGLDFYTLFYDHYATRDIHGDFFANVFPFSREPVTQKLARNWQEFPVYSCWNGGAVLRVEPFIKNQVRFRASNDKVEKCNHSECFNICEDFRRLNYTSIFLNPNVQVTYTHADYLFHEYLMPIGNFFLSLFYYPTPKYAATEKKSAYLNVPCGIPVDDL